MYSLAIIGGVKGIEREYLEVAKEFNCKCKLFNIKCPQFDKKIQNVDCCILFTDTVSHKGIKLIKAHSSSINSLKQSLENLEF